MPRQNISQTQVLENLPDAQVGEVLSGELSRESNAAYTGDAVPQTSEVSLSGAASDDTTYEFTIEGETISYTSGSGATATSVAEGLKSAFEGNIIAFSLATAEIDGNDNVEITARENSGTFDISAGSNTTVSTVTAASDEGNVSVGRAVWYDGSTDEVFTDAGALGVSNSNFGQYFAGITRHTYDTESEEPYSLDSAPFKAYEQVIMLQRGRIFVAGGDNAEYGDSVYVDEVTGEFFTSNAADRIEAPTDLLKWVGPNVIETTLGY